MRVSQKPNRARGRGNRKPSSGVNNINRVFESSGPEGKVRGTPQQIIEKYLSLARDAQTSGHRVIAENFLQHAEHYQRILIEATGERQERNDNQQSGQQSDQQSGQQSGQQPGMERHNSDQPDDNEAGSDGEETTAPGMGQQPRDEMHQNDDKAGSRDRSRRGARDPRDSEVNGLAMIDSGQGDNGNLLVDAEELGASQPRRRPRRRDQEPTEAPAPATTDTPQPE